MQLSNSVRALHAEYTNLAQAGKRSLSDDQIRSIAHFHAEVAVIENPLAFTGSTTKIVKWVQFVHEIERFITARGRLPHQNNRLGPDDIDPDEWELAERLHYRRGRGARAGRLCAYQRRRHACIPGFREHPREASWEIRLEDYRRFVGTYRRAPRYRSEDGFEKSLARWAVTQRTAYRAGTLSPHRQRALSKLTVWTWGKSKRKGREPASPSQPAPKS